MALLQQLYEFNFPEVIRATLGITNDVTELYIKISALHQEEKTCQIRVDFFVSSGGEKLNIPSVYQTFEVNENESSTNTRQQGYEYLKTLEEFQDCIDC